MINRNGLPITNGHISWTVLLSTGSLVVALVAGAASLVKHEINAVREFAAADRDEIRRQLAANDRITDELRRTKVDVARIDQAAQQLRPWSESQAHFEDLQRQINSLNDRLNKLDHGK